MTRRPVRRRLLLVGAMVIGAIAGAAGLVVAMQREAAIDAFGIATTNLGNGMAQQTTQSLASADRAMTEILAHLIVAAGTTPELVGDIMRLKTTLDVMVEQRGRLSGVDSVLLVDADGRVANSTRPAAFVAIDFSNSDVFLHFLSTRDRGVFVGAPVRSVDNGEWTSFMARRVDSAGGGFAGLVVAEISLRALQQFYQLAMPPHRSVYLERRDGVILVRYPPHDDEIGRTIPAQSPWYSIAAQGGGKYEAAGFFDPTIVIGAVQPLRNLPFVVEASVTEGFALAEWRQQRWWIVAGGGASIAGTIVLLRLFAGQYRRIELSELALAVKNAQLGIAHGQLDATLANLSQGVCFYDEDQRLVVCNQAYRTVNGLPDEAIRPGMSFREVCQLRIAHGSFGQVELEAYLDDFAATVRLGSPKVTTNKRTDGRSVTAHVQPLLGRGWVVTIEDVTERCEAEAKVAFLARHDALTGLANRSLFQEQLQQALGMAERGRGFALFCLDLDGFKAVNDTFGHPIGDMLLRAVTGRLLAIMRETDTVARLGGDEFAILQLEVSVAEEVTVAARHLAEAITEPFELEGHHVSVGVSIGIALAPSDSLQPERLMKAADLALYRAKQEGRGTWRFFETAMDAVARTRRSLEVDLRGALGAGQLELQYQPMVWAADRSLTGFEAFLRWDHPVRGPVPPTEFIPIAEEAGLIGEIGAWVLHQACSEASTWPDSLRVSVNLSSRQFRGQNLVRVVTDALQRASLSPERLELEITEAVPLQQSKAALSILHDLRDLGIRIALDDFGTGYSSLSYLRSFPFDTIKIDRAFIADLQSGETNVLLVRGIVGLATRMRMNVTAEGVETEAQLTVLADAGCSEIQGFLISKPVAAREIPALIERLSGQFRPAMHSIRSLGNGEDRRRLGTA